MNYLWLYLLFCTTCGVLSKRGDINIPANLTSTCNSAVVCSECLQKPGCVWCSRPEFTNPDGTLRYRCNERQDRNLNSMTLPCGADNIVDFPAQQNLTANADFGKRQSSSSVHIKPQGISVRIRPNEPTNLTLSFKQLDDYAVDLYYVMDLSRSMEVHKSKLSQLGSLLSQTMSSITSNFKLGFGSFIDKDIGPFCSEYPRKADEEDIPYLFQHHMKLESNATKFSEEVMKAKTHTNLDSPEGGLEALMQAVVCKNNIGWRADARRLLIFSTDAEYHLAGDGRLAGITVPNDEKCHLSPDGSYTHDRHHDYPSIAQVSSQIAKNSIHVIFAVTGSHVELYSRLKDRIPGAAVAELSEDSDNVVDIVKEQYNRITQAVELRHKAPNYIRVNYSSSCMDKNGPLKETNRCEGLKTGSIVDFTITIEALGCPSGKDYSEVIEIFPVGINEVLKVDLQVVCECPCDKPEKENASLDKTYCSGNGRYRCGTCLCKPGFSGQKCECGANQRRNDRDLSRNCRKPNSSEPLCSNRGTCECGVCTCHSEGEDKVWGPYCECDNFSCRRENGLVCSGPEHGTCDCGVCKCLPGWTGPACEVCSRSEETCRASPHVDICSGKGSCVCGKCVCNADELGRRYSGTYCEICPDCVACVKNKDCVQCSVFQSGQLSKEDCRRCSLNITIVDHATEESKDERLCSFVDQSDGCQFRFVYDVRFPNNIRVEKEKLCPAKADVLGIAVGVIGAVVAIGLALLVIWKILTTIHDKLEYEKFERERQQAKWDRSDNPIYRIPTSVFRNPAYQEN